jgi:hypothetical protein
VIPKRGAYPAIDYLIEKLNCTEVVYITMTPSEKKTQEDNLFRDLIALRKRVIGMADSTFGVKPHTTTFGEMVAYESFISSYVQFIYKEVNK